ncbi:MAG: S8 family serine peptidase [Bryobacteraceae bacterium]
MTRKYIFLPLAGLLSLAIASGQLLPGRYIVELAENPAAAALTRRAAIRDQQDRLRRRVEQADTTVSGSVETVANALFVRMSAKRAAEVARLPGVVEVHQERLYKLTLDHALGLQRVTDAWGQIGGASNAGRGIRIGIIDTGIDAGHPAFQNSGLPPVDGFPKVNRDTDLKFTNSKIIVARSYDDSSVLGSPADDRKGHGTGVAMIAAGLTNAGPLATITGVAPGAYLGNYKVFPDSLSGAPSSTILKALDDAVSDGMDVVNLSLGSYPAERPADDFLVRAVERVAAAGVIVVIAAGNEGPELHSIASPGTAPSAITVGNSLNERIFAATTIVEGVGLPYESFPGSGPNQLSAATGPLVDTSTLGDNSLACDSFPSGSLRGKIAFILRGTCTFETKLNNADAAGAIAALVYTSAAQPDGFTMSVGAARLPASLVSNGDGVDIKRRLAEAGVLQGTLSFDKSPFLVNSNRIDNSSSRGPSSDDSIKPDLLAVGSSVYTAWARSLGTGGYITASGTSLSAPMVTGAVALLKAARPGLTPRQYKSLLINSTSTFSIDSLKPVPVGAGGAGLLNMSAALTSTVATLPASLGFGIGGNTVDSSRTVTLMNLGAGADTFSISASRIGDGIIPSVSDSSVQVDGGGAKSITVKLEGTQLSPGQYQGFLSIRSTLTDVETRLPFWYGVPSKVAEQIIVFDAPAEGRRLSELSFQFRPLDASGIPTTDSPVVTATIGGGTVIGTDSLDSQVPGLYETAVRLGPSRVDNVFEIRVGNTVTSVTITAR